MEVIKLMMFVYHRQLTLKSEQLVDAKLNVNFEHLVDGVVGLVHGEPLQEVVEVAAVGADGQIVPLRVGPDVPGQAKGGGSELR